MIELDAQFMQSDEVRTAFEGLTKSMEAFIAKRPEMQMTEEAAEQVPKSWFVDPYNVLDSMGLGYRHTNSYLTYETLKTAAKKSTLIGSIIITRINQVASFCKPQKDKFSTGFVIQYKNNKYAHDRLTPSQKERILRVKEFILNMGSNRNPGRDKFDTAVKKLVRDRLTYDQACFEKVWTRGGNLLEAHVVAGDTIRIASPKNKKNTPLREDEVDYVTKYVQLINGNVVKRYTMKELAFLVGNPRSDVYANGYGYPEIEILITTITAHLWAEEWNRRAFSQGSTIKGLINVLGNIKEEKFLALKRQWLMQLSGINNAWKTPMINSPNQIQFLPLQMNNMEMGYGQWMEYLIKMACAVYQIDPSEINFDLRGGMQQQPMFMSNNQAQQEVSKDKGLPPLLEYVESGVQTNIVEELDDELEFKFVGFKAKTEEQNAQLRQQQGSTMYTLNEVRAMEDLPKIKGGDIVLNPTYTGHLSMMQQQQQQQGQGDAPGGQPGGDEGQDDQGPPNPFNAQHGAEEKEGADKLREHAHGSPSEDESSPDDPEEAEGGLQRNDWSNTLRRSLNTRGKLTKAFYDEVEV